MEVEIVSMETNSTSISTANSKADIKEKMPKPKCWDVSGVPFEGNASNIMLAAKATQRLLQQTGYALFFCLHNIHYTVICNFPSIKVEKSEIFFHKKSVF